MDIFLTRAYNSIKDKNIFKKSKDLSFPLYDGYIDLMQRDLRRQNVNMRPFFNIPSDPSDDDIIELRYARRVMSDILSEEFIKYEDVMKECIIFVYLTDSLFEPRTSCFKVHCTVLPIIGNNQEQN